MPPTSPIEAAVNALRDGKVIAYPTEAVWGLGCDPKDAQAVETLLKLKARDANKGLILIGSQRAHFDAYIAKPTGPILQYMQNYWPGSTLLLPKSTSCSSLISGAHPKVAARLSQHPLVVAICERFGGAIISTSANRATHPPAKTLDEVRAYFGEAVILVPGELGLAKTVSRIIDTETGAIVR